MKLPAENLNRLFGEIVKKEEGLKEAAMALRVTERTLRDWRRGAYSMSQNAFSGLLRRTGMRKNDFSPQILPEFWHILAASKKGAIARMKQHGNFGTAEGRRRGGLISVVTHQKYKTNFKTLAPIKKPVRSNELAEFLGALFGDGHLSKYQVLLTTNAETDRQHAAFFGDLAKKLFHVSPVLRKSKDDNSLAVVISSKALVNFLHELGMPTGNKIQKGLSIPLWVLENDAYQRAFLRGLFDTDGCVYQDIHKTKRRTYKYLGWTITSYADSLKKDVVIILKNLGFSPTHRITQNSVFLRKQKEVARYFEKIGSHNQKHLNRYNTLSGRVPKRS